MAAVDWILLVVLFASLLIGLWRGLVFEVLSLLGWIAAFLCAGWFGKEVSQWLPFGQPGDTARVAAGYVIVFVATAFGFGLVASLLRKLVATVGLRPVDRTLGAAFGLVRGMLVLLVAAWVIEATSMRTSPWWLESRGAPMLRAVLAGLKPALPDAFGMKLST